MEIPGNDANELNELAVALRHVIWIGGAPDAGKSTLAHELARKHDLRLYIQDRYEMAHFARATAKRHPEMRAFWEMSIDERWVLRTPEEMAAQVVRSSAERFELLVEDILNEPRDAPMLVEGPWLLPELVAPALTDPRQALWLSPTPEFKQASAAKRGKPGMSHETGDPDRATRNWRERDRLLAEHICRSVAALGLTLWEVDGSVTPEETVLRAERHFALWLAHQAS
jgi:hypothetical protein